MASTHSSGGKAPEAFDNFLHRLDDPTRKVPRQLLAHERITRTATGRRRSECHHTHLLHCLRKPVEDEPNPSPNGDLQLFRNRSTNTQISLRDIGTNTSRRQDKDIKTKDIGTDMDPKNYTSNKKTNTVQAELIASDLRHRSTNTPQIVLYNVGTNTRKPSSPKIIFVKPETKDIGTDMGPKNNTSNKKINTDQSKLTKSETETIELGNMDIKTRTEHPKDVEPLLAHGPKEYFGTYSVLQMDDNPANSLSRIRIVECPEKENTTRGEETVNFLASGTTMLCVVSASLNISQSACERWIQDNFLENHNAQLRFQRATDISVHGSVLIWSAFVAAFAFGAAFGWIFAKQRYSNTSKVRIPLTAALIVNIVGVFLIVASKPLDEPYMLLTGRFVAGFTSAMANRLTELLLETTTITAKQPKRLFKQQIIANNTDFVAFISTLTTGFGEENNWQWACGLTAVLAIILLCSLWLPVLVRKTCVGRFLLKCILKWPKKLQCLRPNVFKHIQNTNAEEDMQKLVDQLSEQLFIFGLQMESPLVELASGEGTVGELFDKSAEYYHGKGSKKVEAKKEAQEQLRVSQDRKQEQLAKKINNRKLDLRRIYRALGCDMCTCSAEWIGNAVSSLVIVGAVSSTQIFSAYSTQILKTLGKDNESAGSEDKAILATLLIGGSKGIFPWLTNRCFKHRTERWKAIAALVLATFSFAIFIAITSSEIAQGIAVASATASVSTLTYAYNVLKQSKLVGPRRYWLTVGLTQLCYTNFRKAVGMPLSFTPCVILCFFACIAVIVNKTASGTVKTTATENMA